MIWNMLKRHVSRRNPTTKGQLSEYCREFWDNELNPEVCTRFIEHNYKEVSLTVKLGGKATGDLPKKMIKETSAGKDVSYFNDQLATKESEKQFCKLTFHW